MSKKIINVLFLFSVTLTLFSNCKKDESNIEDTTPTLTTIEANDIQINSASSGGIISNDGGSFITARGVCYSISHNPTYDSCKTIDGIGKGSYTSKITNLKNNTTYYVRAYAINSKGISYGNEVSFRSHSGLPVVITNGYNIIDSSSAKCNGTIISDGGSPIIESGICWKFGPEPTVFDKTIISENNPSTFTCTITGISTNAPYYFRAYATNANGTAYGKSFSFWK